LASTSPFRVRRQHLALHPLLHLASAVLVCVVLPFAIWTSTIPLGWFEPEARHTALASFVALIVGFWLQHSFTSLPGTRESSGILPGYTMGYGLCLTAILLLRIDYSRALLIIGYVLAVVWFYIAYLLTQRRTSLRVGVVEGGRTDLFAGLTHVAARPLRIDDPIDDLDAVAADFRYDHSPAWEARMADLVLSGMPVYHTKDLYESLSGKADLEHLSENNFGSLAPLAPFQIAKGIVDRLIALPALLAASPVMLLAAIAIRLDSSGPILFRQTRIGFRGRPFTALKFRTMRTSGKAGKGRGEFITQENDPRVTRIGRFLRRSRIDELPQIINVLKGEMSWIGPRPEALALSEWYEAEIPFYRYRHIVVPGITGWAQVSQGHVAELDDVRLKLQYDFFYIRNFSIWMDLLIIAKTVRTVLSGFGAR
jgi:lipopolysaccharide/colanic/teichoic acid biosynthesis glycosyltransferase